MRDRALRICVRTLDIRVVPLTNNANNIPRRTFISLRMLLSDYINRYIRLSLGFAMCRFDISVTNKKLHPKYLS